MSKLRGMVLGSFVGDALALGPHWVYNIEDIRKQLGEITGLTSPMTNYHKEKNKGDFTHYGDQTLMLFQYLRVNQVIEPEPFYQNYMEFFNNYKGYRDHATTETLDNLKNQLHTGSHSSELGGFARFAPVVYLNPADRTKGIEQVLLQTKLTHNNDKLLERSRFLTQLVYMVLKGEKPSDAINVLRKDISKSIFDDIESAKRQLQGPSQLAIKQLGQSCDCIYAFPAVIYFILKYEEDFKTALIENVYAGGDSAARGMVIGAILGAYHGEDKIPVNWLASMNQLKPIEHLLMTS